MLASVVWLHVNNCFKGAVACLYQVIMLGHQTGGSITG